MNAPPEKESMKSFLFVSDLLHTHSVHVPKIFAVNQPAGFMLLEDFGDTLLLNVVDSEAAIPCYEKALDILLQLRNYNRNNPAKLPLFDIDYMMKEMMLCTTWFLTQYTKTPLSDLEENILKESYFAIAQSIAKQEATFVHRDFHSRNIMIVDTRTPKLGIIDFQDAMLGPYTYDLVSLLKDCYIALPNETQRRWLEYFYHKAGIKAHKPYAEFEKDFHVCGLQRHIKVLGIFSRLYLRDNKSGYLQDLPLTLNYIIQCLEQLVFYPELLTIFQRIRLP